MGPRFAVAFQRTLRIPDDDRDYPLPPGLGRLPVVEVGGTPVVPLRQGEALWLAFDGPWWRPNAAQVAIGGVNAVSGGPFDDGLNDDPQNYLVTPDQPWLDGINAGEATVRQFVAVPLGSGTTVEAQISGKEVRGGLQLRVFEPKRGRFPSRPPPPDPTELFLPMAAPVHVGAATAMGLAAGGRMRQRVHPDPYGIDTWDVRRRGEVDVRIVNSEEFRRLTGREPPASPVTAQLYTEHGLPWFGLYDADAGDLAAPAGLAGVKSVNELTGEESERIDVTAARVRAILRRDLQRPG